MTILSLAAKRRTVRQFHRDPIPQDILERVVQVGLLEAGEYRLQTLVALGKPAAEPVTKELPDLKECFRTLD